MVRARGSEGTAARREFWLGVRARCCFGRHQDRVRMTWLPRRHTARLLHGLLLGAHMTDGRWFVLFVRGATRAARACADGTPGAMRHSARSSSSRCSWRRALVHGCCAAAFAQAPCSGCSLSSPPGIRVLSLTLRGSLLRPCAIWLLVRRPTTDGDRSDTTTQPTKPRLHGLIKSRAYQERERENNRDGRPTRNMVLRPHPQLGIA